MLSAELIGCFVVEDHFAKLPLMFIEVLSLDEWDRYRTEGYGYLSLPYMPGSILIIVNVLLVFIIYSEI